MMRLIAVTEPTFRADEPEAIRLLLDEGIDRIHLRKPGSDECRMRRLVESLPGECFPRLTLHDHLPLAVEYGIGGVHLSGRNPEPPARFGGLLSRSCHSLRELAACREEDYLFLSPIFDSISKAGYRAGFSARELSEAACAGVITGRTVALGGIRPEHLPALREYGFGGAALLGYLWQSPSPAEMVRRIAKLKRYNEL
ncbi:MAG: thiamine phosphate synthase [Alistipes sp.]|nr:thiamine phosphate synthase [Alistipes sp.]